MKYTYEEVHEAYIKLKTYIYYDSTNLYMRKQLAAFETDLFDEQIPFMGRRYKLFEAEYGVKLSDAQELMTYEKKLLVFVEAINNFNKNSSYFEFFLKRIEAKFLPKKIYDKNKDSKIVSNKRTNEKYEIERSAVFIDAPIEIHLISVLWILKKGVDLDKDLFDGCLGNRLILNKAKDKVVQGSGLFKPYPRQYQKWRDDAVKKANEHLKNGEDVLILNLDIRDFFYSVRIPKKQIEASPYRKILAFSAYNNLYKIFGKIHELFTLKILEIKNPYDFSADVFADDKLINYILPIGLLSSFVLANDHLKDFDSRIIKHSRPIYYGRYVDDILMVIANPVLPEDHIEDSIEQLNFSFPEYKKYIQISGTHDEEEKLSASDYKKDLTDLEKFVLRNFHPIITLIDKPQFLTLNNVQEGSSSSNRVFKLNGFARLYCQSDKTLLYYFDKDESALVIDKLKRDLEEKSSEFRNYNDEEGEEDFEESAYHLLYDGTEGKIRTLKDYKEDKFGLSVYLSKRIFNALRRADKISQAEAEKIVRFFQGSNTLNLYTLWERVFVFLLVNKKPEAYVQFYLSCCEAISRISFLDSEKSKFNSRYKKNVFEYLDCANELALSLYPKFLSDVRKVKKTYKFSINAMKDDLQLYKVSFDVTDENSFFIRRFRQSNLLRHHYVAQPLLSYEITSKRNFPNLTNLKLPL